jgi:hypothetical protein
MSRGNYVVVLQKFTDDTKYGDDANIFMSQDAHRQASDKARPAYYDAEINPSLCPRQSDTLRRHLLTSRRRIVGVR